MPWYKITIVNDADVELKTGLLFSMEAAWLVDQAPDAARYRSSSASEHLFFVSLALAQNAKEPLNRFHAVQCYPPTIAHLSQLIPGPKDKVPTIPSNRKRLS
jgi:hypothetical protein